VTVLASGFDLEDAIDGLVDVFIGPEFFASLRAVHARKRNPIELRPLEVAYGDEVENPGGYPALELIAIDQEKPGGSESVLLECEISAQFTVNGDNADVMRRELQRFIQATREHCEGMSLLPFAGNSVIETGRADFSPLSGRRDNTAGSGKYLKSASIQVFYRMPYQRQRG
jgi:hypothetical protein